jgi:NCS1 family nucleobase:cation symporter-1
MITGVIGELIVPWYLYENPSLYIFTWLQTYGGLLGSVAGVLIGGYWIINRTNLDLVDLYRANGRYWFSAGFNWRALVATAVGVVLAVGGAYTKAGTQGPFPADGLIPFLKPLYDYSWAIGLVASLLTFVVLSRPAQRREPVATPEPATA